MLKSKILIVDDYPENIRALSELIQTDDVELYSAVNAQGALDLLTQHDFSLGLLDVQMPETTGFELARLIRGVSQYKSLPIIFVTAHSETSELVLEGYDTGAVDLLFKPLSPQVVRSKVRVFVELDRQQRLLKEKLEEVERLKLAADAANIAKGNFLANMSHEIRTPLAGVIGFSEMIVKGQLSEKEKSECAAAVKRNGNLLLRLIDDILDFSKIESGGLDLEKISFDFGELLRDVDAAMTLKAQQKGLELTYKVDQSVEGKFIGDPTRIKQVLLNVIGNAIKFTEKGSIDVFVRSESLKTDGHQSQSVVIHVKDQGIGLSPNQASRLFKPFAQADASTTRRFGGSGLGLTISKRIANRMGGNVEVVESALGKGSTFKITFMLDTAPGKTTSSDHADAPVAVVQKKLDLTGFRILAVDDSPDNLVLIKFFLKSTNAELVTADGGEEALRKVAENKFDMIFMDLQMPGLDGHTTTKMLRKDGFKAPIVALTAHALKAEHDKCKESGCDDVVVKPVNRDALLETLKKFLILDPPQLSI